MEVYCIIFIMAPPAACNDIRSISLVSICEILVPNSKPSLLITYLFSTLSDLVSHVLDNLGPNVEFRTKAQVCSFSHKRESWSYKPTLLSVVFAFSPYDPST